MEEVKRNSLQAWILAARPKTLTGAVTPVLIGTALAAMDGHFHWLPALICCLFASLMQIAALTLTFVALAFASDNNNGAALTEEV